MIERRQYKLELQIPKMTTTTTTPDICLWLDCFICDMIDWFKLRIINISNNVALSRNIIVITGYVLVLWHYRSWMLFSSWFSNPQFMDSRSRNWCFLGCGWSPITVELISSHESWRVIIHTLISVLSLLQLFHLSFLWLLLVFLWLLLVFS
jgi:hypothetical protein